MSANLPLDVPPCKVTILGITVTVAQEDVSSLTERLSAAVAQGRHGWVLVKGYHDSGTIDGVYGPYTEAYIDWMLREPLSNSYGNWTKTRLQSGPEET